MGPPELALVAWSNQPAGNVVYTLMCRYMQSAAFPGHEKNARQQRLALMKQQLRNDVDAAAADVAKHLRHNIYSLSYWSWPVH